MLSLTPWSLPGAATYQGTGNLAVARPQQGGPICVLAPGSAEERIVSHAGVAIVHQLVAWRPVAKMGRARGPREPKPRPHPGSDETVCAPDSRLGTPGARRGGSIYREDRAAMRATGPPPSGPWCS